MRYIIGRWGYSQNVLAWEFFNEIDNSYFLLNVNDVRSWHGAMSEWLHANDPYKHLVTTSLKGGSDDSLLWNLPHLDFACYHSYGEQAHARRFSAVTHPVADMIWPAPESDNDDSASPDIRGHKRLLEDFLRAIETNSKPRCDGREGRRSVALVQAIYESSRTGSAVKLTT
jgi:predicted dehydrogenase